MASSVAASGLEASSASPKRVGDVRPYQALVCAIWLGYLIWGATAHHSSLAHRWPQLLPWIALLGLVNLLPIEGWHAHMVPDPPAPRGSSA